LPTISPLPAANVVSVIVAPIEAPSDDAECVSLATALSSAVGAALVPIANTTVRMHAASGSAFAPGETMIDGSVRRSGRRVRIALRAHASDGTLRWSQQLDGSIDDVFELEDAATQHVQTYVSGLSAVSGASVGLTRGRAPLSDADYLVAEGLRAFNQFGPTGGAAARAHLDEATAYLTKALALEPRHARGLCAMGNVFYVSAVNGGESRAELLARGRELIFSALAADDQCAEVHCSLGKIALYHDDDFHSAARHVRRAAELDPSEPEALRLLSIVYKILGQSEDSVRAAVTATEHAPESAPLWNALGDALLAAGRNAEAVDALKSAIRILPGYGPALERMELARTRLGEFGLAAELRASRLRLAGQRERAATIETEAASVGAAVALARDVRRELDALLAKAALEDPFADYVRRNVADRIVNAYADLGEWAHAMDWVERAYEQRPGRLRRMLADLPVDYRGLAADPRYARLMRVAGMEDMI
jgi:tetratricopeptide (TPR) repeat protein